MRRAVKSTVLLGAVIALCAVIIFAWFARDHIRFAFLFAWTGINAQGYPEYRHRQTGIVFVRLPGGTFWMGAQSEDPEGRNYDPEAIDHLDAPVHQVKLSPFLIGKYEVTQGEWKAVMGTNPSYFQPGSGGEPKIPSGVNADDLPVEDVCW
jgi:formylglycine-generating enzyme required for sulfatase activity